jgi:pyrrolidone-carboxylate peptidase
MEKIENGSLDIKATFIHLPALPNQAIEKDMVYMATMPLDLQVKALEIIIESLS